MIASANASVTIAAGVASRPAPELLRAYEVNRKVSDFPDRQDLSTPEAAYATFNRILAGGERAPWRRLSVRRLAGQFPAGAEKREVSPKAAHEWLHADILEVRIFKGKYAAAFARIPNAAQTIIDIRFLEKEEGRWLNSGNNVGPDLAEARTKFAGWCSQFVEKPVRPRIDDPDSHLRRFVEFLKANGQEPKALVMKALAEYTLVIMGEIHHRPRYWALNSSLVTDPDFPRHVGTIYMELPSNDQQLVEKFLASKDCDTKPVVEMLRDNLWMGWPDQAMLNFFMKVWMVNRNLAPEQKLRIVLVDMQRPWKDIHEREDWRKYNVDRDRFMADNVLRDVKQHPQERRNALFIVGVGHTMLDLKYFEGSPVTSAGWHLRQGLGAEKVYAIFPHTCVMTNWGRVDGRLCMGLFESAFAAVGNRPLAFPLARGPFGEQPFDALPDQPVSSAYRDGYSAYLYLGPLEHEIFSPLIAGFYTDEFVKELDRRHRMMFGEGLVQGCRLAALDAESFIGWMGNSWGRPRREWRSEFLGPLNAWQHGGSDWKQAARDARYEDALQHPDQIVKAATELFDAIRAADYNNPQTWKDHPDAWKQFISVDYTVATDYPSWVKWICETFKPNPIQSVELGEVFASRRHSFSVGPVDLPTIRYKLTLKDGTELKGALPFEYDAMRQRWTGQQGIDWHLQYKSGLPPKAAGAGKRAAEGEPASRGAASRTREGESVDLSTPEAAVTSWTKAVATGKKGRALACMLPGGVDYDDVERILSADPSSRAYFIKQMWEAIDPGKPVRILRREQGGGRVTITWQVRFKREVSIRGRTFKSGDTFELDATLKQRGGDWLIDGI
ncbi:MAG: hypothetical protein AMJ81_08295 [Phycisphaerae bacterium SM23_33]|nr:MAG: hypothetical protein AMJ81_08295 [Phycisphaerae bacterium SM23_33]